MSLIATAVVFPINGAYERRERALAAYGAVKANGHAIHLSFRDWPHDFDTADMQHKSKATLAQLMGGTDTCYTALSANFLFTR